MVKKIVAILICIMMCVMALPSIGCGEDAILNVYNCYDYILDEDDESLIEEFEEYYKEKTGLKIKVKYSCFDTPEDAYNNLKINPTGYDLICPSDYMIEKMAREGMLQKFTMDENGAYMKNVSPFINEVFSSITWGENEKLSDYAVGYMWGTLGLVYNSEKITDEAMESWTALWSETYKGQFSIKDSVRDTYFICLAKCYGEDLAQAQGDADKLKEIFNRTDANTIAKVKEELQNLAKNCKNLEVDEGKDDITKGNIDINFAWSGDAVYALELGEENGLKLKYSVPNEGSNIWFDGWVIPKDSTNVDLAKEFLDFISTPENVVRNMDYIGYTSCVAGQEVFEYVKDSYDEGKGTETDLSYFFGEGDYKIKTEVVKGQFYAQYPTEEVIKRCAVMSYFKDEDNKAINEMWINIKNNIN